MCFMIATSKRTIVEIGTISTKQRRIDVTDGPGGVVISTGDDGTMPDRSAKRKMRKKVRIYFLVHGVESKMFIDH